MVDTTQLERRKIKLLLLFLPAIAALGGISPSALPAADDKLSPSFTCYYSMPTEGLDNFSYDYVKGMNDLWCCTYKLNGDEGIITWGTGGSTVGLKLEGTFRRDDWKDEISPKEGITLFVISTRRFVKVGIIRNQD